MPRSGRPSRTSSNILSADGHVLFLASHEHPLDSLARLIVARERTRLPDLSEVVVLLPDAGLANPLRERLLFHAHAVGTTALVPPFIGTPDVWLAHVTAEPPASEVRRTLSLLDVTAPVFSERLPWLTATERLTLAQELRSIFDAWEQSPPASLRALIELLARHYGVKDELAPMTDEARLVYECWRQWQTHVRSRRGASLKRARFSEQKPNQGDGCIYVCGFQEWGRDEATWLARELRAGHAVFVGHAPSCYIHELPVSVDAADACAGLDAADLFLQAAFGVGRLDQRVAEARGSASPFAGSIRWYEAPGFEEEAQAVVAGVLNYLSEGVNSVGVVSMDRKLARRVRALLEHDGVMCADSAGWRLSTTSAAEALRIWWQACVNDRTNNPFVILAASPFFSETPNIRPGSVFSDARQDRLEKAAELLRTLFSTERARPIGVTLAALLHSIEQCGLAQSLEHDDAGRVLLSEIGRLADDARDCHTTLTAPEFFRWLTDQLEARRFSVGPPQAPVRLLSLAESRMYRFDAAILTGADAAHLPGAPGHPVFFNETTHRELGLASADTASEVLRLDFLRLLRAAPNILVTWRRQDGDRTVAQSPWFERLRLFHQLAYGSDFEAVSALPGDGALRPRTGVARPAPIVPPDRVPARISARAHQRLIDCPYQYFVAEVLHLRRRMEPDEDRSYAEYGERVHRILEAFHHGVPGLPGPFSGPVTAENRGAAADLLTAISLAVFEPDSDFSRRLALNQWLEVSNAFLDWELEHGAAFRVCAVEASIQRPLAPSGPILFGRIDRIDEGAQGQRLIDYKTGALPRLDEIRSGEQTQLAFYSALAGEGVCGAYLLSLKDTVKQLGLDGPELVEISQRTVARVAEVHQLLTEGAALPANGCESACGICDYEGLCRRSFWTENPRPAG